MKNIYVSYGKKKILNDISIEFHPNILYGIIGPNGVGKSTLLNVISRDIPMNSGEVLLKGKQLGDYSQKEMAKELSYMRQSTIVKFPYTLKELVSMGRYAHDSMSREDNDIIINTRIKENDLSEYCDKPLTQLSGGEVQRAFFTKVLAQESNAILVDEGLSNADIFYKVRFFKQLRSEVEKGKLVIMVIHDLSLARKYCDELIILNHDGIYDCGKSEEVLTSQTLYDVFKVKGDFFNHSLVLE
ncbi:ABC transporter ATP-binding protein [Acetobacterium carbinolicum]|jgi:iron complex transport system ATP-binding protein|uniref:ABC transporter ATP-binding protein n=1 Tax=Acetobacterium TaxID=33951 RepID=UPI0013A6D583|nr:ABC transporter ATP-binding protein [Acetobacterium sp. KB-1]